MTTRRTRKPILLLPGGAGRTLQERVYTSLRDAIIEGRLVRGARVPASRALAEEWNVARNTVLRAMEQLVTEGYVETYGIKVSQRALVPEATAALGKVRFEEWLARNH